MSILQMALTQRVGGVDCTTTWALCDNINRGASPLLVNAAVEYFESVFLPLLNALQSDELTNVELYAIQIGYVSTSRNVALAGGGALAVAGSVTLPPYLALYVRETVGLSVNAETGGSYDQARAIRRGGVYLPGMTEDWVDVTGVQIPVSLAGAWTSFENEIAAPSVVALEGDPFYHAVWVPAKAATPPSSTYPLGKPASPFLQAPITNLTPSVISRLKSRKA